MPFLWKRRSTSEILSAICYSSNIEPDISLTVLSTQINTGIPFNYALFAFIISLYIARRRADATLNLDQIRLTNRTSKIVHHQIRPLLEFLLNKRPISSPWENPSEYIVGHRVRSISCFDLLESAVFAHQEYCKLKSRCLHAEADVFILYANKSLHKKYYSNESILELTQVVQALRNVDYYSNDLHVCIMQCYKMMLEFSILANSVHSSLCRSAPTGCMSSSIHDMCFGLSDLDRARFYVSTGLSTLRRVACKNSPSSSRDDFAIRDASNKLALALVMFPENESWKLEIDSSMSLNRELNGKMFEDELDLSLKVFPEDEGFEWGEPRIHEYLDSEGLPREYFGSLSIDAWFSQLETLEHLPTLQRFSLSCVEALEKRLGIENGEWWPGCKDADVDGLSDGMEELSTSEGVKV